MPRKKINYDVIPARFPEGTFDRIETVLGPEETRTAFIRRAIEHEIADRRAVSGTDAFQLSPASASPD